MPSCPLSLSFRLRDNDSIQLSPQSSRVWSQKDLGGRWLCCHRAVLLEPVGEVRGQRSRTLQAGRNPISVIY